MGLTKLSGWWAGAVDELFQLERGGQQGPAMLLCPMRGELPETVREREWRA